MDTRTHSAPVVLYDGVCGFCNRSVQMIIAADKRALFRFAPLQTRYAEGVKRDFPSLRLIDSIALLESSQREEKELYVRSTAILRIALHLGGWWRILLLGYLIPRPIRDYLYALFARYRYRLFGKYDRCVIPPPEHRSRFLDLVE